MSYYLFIDDLRNPPESVLGLAAKDGCELVVARTSQSAIETIENRGCPEVIYFDHDLGGEDTTIPVVDFLITKDLDSGFKFLNGLKRFFVHSANPVGEANITGKLKGYLEFRKEQKDEKA